MSKCTCDCPCCRNGKCTSDECTCSCGCKCTAGECTCSCCTCLSYGKGKFEINACVERMGKDAVIMMGGGEKPHAGCVVICEPDKATGKVTASVHNFTTHREEVVARPIAEAICRKIKARVVCICGIHVNNASKKEIALLVKNTEQVGKRLLKCF